MAALSVLDLVPIVSGSSPADAFRNALDLARRVEAWGYQRYWLAEHHNMPGIASAATAVLMAHIAGGTSRIRVGSGGIMLPNHAPLVIAEQFGTLASLFPSRIDLGIGRAPGTDPMTARALRREHLSSGDTFPENFAELTHYLAADPQAAVRAVPCQGTQVPVWILGSSLFGAEFAARHGLPYAFASHFAPAELWPALRRYRSSFRASAALANPYLMLGVNVFVADTEERARLLFTSLAQAFLQLRRGQPGQLPPPKLDFEAQLSAEERQLLEHVLAVSFVGTQAQVAAELKAFIAQTEADELMVSSHIFDHADRLRSYELLAGCGI